MAAFDQITMPSGTYVTAGYGCSSPDECRLDIGVYPIVEDYGLTEGLCGNFNGIADDDLTPRGSTNVDSGREPILFTNSYMSVEMHNEMFHFDMLKKS